MSESLTNRPPTSPEPPTGVASPVDQAPPNRPGTFAGLKGCIAGGKAAASSVFLGVLVGTYVSVGALAHGLDFPLLWVMLSTVLVWAAPAQVILISSLGVGAPPVEVGIAVGLSGMRLLPMAVALLPILKGKETRTRDLLLPAHFTAVSMWVETLRLAPGQPRASRIGFANGVGTVFMGVSVLACVIGYEAAALLPELLTAALLFLTPMSFLTSVTRNSRMLSDRLAFLAGIVLGPLLVYEKIGLDLLWTGLAGGSGAYLIHRLRKSLR